MNQFCAASGLVGGYALDSTEVSASSTHVGMAAGSLSPQDRLAGVGYLRHDKRSKS